MTKNRSRKDLVLVTVAYGFSTMGTTAAFLAMVLHLREAGPGWITALLLAELTPFILMGPLAGMLVDRFESRALLIAMSVGQAAVSLGLSMVTQPIAIVGLVALLGMQAAVERPAASALVPHITGEEGATRGYARLSTGRALGAISGPAVGGLVSVTGSIRPALTVNAVSFIVLALVLTRVSARRRPAELRGEDGTEGESARAGFQLILRSPVLRLAIPLTALAAGIALADNVAAPYRFTDDLGAGPLGFGVYEALYSVCELIGIQAFASESSKGKEEKLLGIGNLLLGLGILGIGLAGSYGLALAVACLGGVGNGMSNAGESAVVRAHTPEHLRGRAFAASGALIQTVSIGGALGGAPAVAAFGAASTMVASGAIAASIAAIALTLAVVRPVPRRRVAAGWRLSRLRRRQQLEERSSLLPIERSSDSSP